MRPLVVVVVVPFVCLLLDILQSAEDVSVEYSPAVASVEALYVAVLCRASGLREQQPDVVTLAPLLEVLGYELGSVVASDVARFAFKPYHLLKCPYHSLGRERHGHLLGYSHTVTVVDDVQDTELPSAFKHVADKVYRPRDVGFQRLLQRVLDPCRETFLKSETLLIVHAFVNTIHFLVVPRLAVTTKPLEDLPEPVAVFGGCPYRLLNLRVVPFLAVIEVRPVYLHHSARPSDAHLIFFHDAVRQFFLDLGL